MLRGKGVKARTWAEVASEKIAHGGSLKIGGKAKGLSGAKGGSGATGGGGGGAAAAAASSGVIVAVKSVEGQGINMQHDADTIVCRPTPGDHLEQASEP